MLVPTNPTPLGNPPLPFNIQILASKQSSAVKAVSEVFAEKVKVRLSNAEKIEKEASARNMFVSDVGSHNATLVQSICYDNSLSFTPIGLMDYNAFTKVVPVIINAGQEIASYHAYRQGADYKFFSEKTLNLGQATSYAAYKVCQTSNMAYNIAKNINSQAAEPAKQTFSVVGQISMSLLAIFSIFRGLGSLFKGIKLGSYKSAINNPMDLNGKINGLKSLVRVSDDEVLLKAGDTGAARIAHFEAYYQAKTASPDVLLALSAQGIHHIPDLGPLTEGLSRPEFKSFLCQKLEINPDTVEGFTAQAFLGLVAKKMDMSYEKQIKFIDDIGENTAHKEQLKKVINTALKVRQVGACHLGPFERDELTISLLKKVDVAINRKQFKEWATFASCVLTIAAAIGTLAVGAQFIVPVFAVITTFWVLSNLIEYGISVQEYRNIASETQGAHGALSWKTKVAYVVNFLALLLFIGVLCSPLGAGMGLGLIVLATLNLGIFTIHNLLLSCQSGRSLMIGFADRVDKYINQCFGNLFKAPIALNTADEAKIDNYQKSRLLQKIKKLSLEEKNALAIQMGIYNGSISSDKTRYRNARATINIVGDEARAAFKATPSGQQQFQMYLDNKFEEKAARNFDVLKQAYEAQRTLHMQTKIQTISSASIR